MSNAKPASTNALPKSNTAEAVPKNNETIPLIKTAPAAMIKAKTTASPANPRATIVTTAAIISGIATGAAQIARMVNQKARHPLRVDA